MRPPPGTVVLAAASVMVLASAGARAYADVPWSLPATDGVDIEKSSCLVLTRVEPDRALAGFHDALAGPRLTFSVRRGRDGELAIRVANGSRTVLVVRSRGGVVSWRLGGVDVVAAAGGDAAARERLAAVLGSEEGRALRALAEDLAALVSAGPTEAGILARALLDASLAGEADASAFGVGNDALRALRLALQPSVP